MGKNYNDLGMKKKTRKVTENEGNKYCKVSKLYLIHPTIKLINWIKWMQTKISERQRIRGDSDRPNDIIDSALHQPAYIYRVFQKGTSEYLEKHKFHKKRFNTKITGLKRAIWWVGQTLDHFKFSIENLTSLRYFGILTFAGTLP